MSGGHPVTATSHEALGQDLTRDAQGYALQVKCEWLPTADPYQVTLGVSRRSDIDSGVSFSMLAVLSAAGPRPSSMTTKRSSSDPQYGTTAADKRCDVSLLDVDMAAQHVWGSFSCDSLENLASTEECQATEGYFYFEGCKPHQ